MKLFMSMIITVWVALASLAPEQAQAFVVHANCSFNPAQGQCTVFNSWAAPIFCRLRANGQLLSGHWANVWQDVMIVPGMYAYVFVNSNNPYNNPLVNVQGLAYCNF